MGKIRLHVIRQPDKKACLIVLGGRLFRRFRAAIAVDMRRSQRPGAVPVQGAFPGIQLFLRKGIALAGLFIGQDASLYRLDNSQFSGFYPALGRRWRQESDFGAVAMQCIRHDRTHLL